MRRWVEDRAGWLALGAVVLVLVFMLGLLAGRNAAQTVPVKDPVYGAPLVKNGVAAVMLCGNWPDKRGLGLTEAAMGKGMWTPAPREGGAKSGSTIPHTRTKSGTEKVRVDHQPPALPVGTGTGTGTDE